MDGWQKTGNPFSVVRINDYGALRAGGARGWARVGGWGGPAPRPPRCAPHNALPPPPSHLTPSTGAGYGRLSVVNTTTLRWVYVDNKAGAVLDEMVITKTQQNFGPGARR